MGEKKEEQEVKKENYHRIESFTGKFSRSFSIPKAIASEKINAEMKNGILYITVPKAEEKKPKTIPIVTK
jgi:HSP20 family protein